ncbi:MAG: hypothetical protein OEV00_02395 [Acidobacteriota bacterium]|nr:hypothetical protein [Acidobacteriota bacterium]MDH3784159.1 hypothetical protein [Acidobacteriota bacterium]
MEPRASSSLVPVLWVAALVIGIAVAAFVWWPTAPPDQAEGADAGETTVDASAGEALEAEAANRVSHWETLLGHEPRWPDDFDEPTACAEIDLDLSRVCAVIDRRSYRGDDRRVGGSCGLLEEVAESLAAHPPDSEGEIKRHAQLLANIFHLSRSVEGKSLTATRRVLREEAYLIEPLSMTLWRWAASRETCVRSGKTSLTDESLYSYAAYVFQTFGGRSLLQRRSPRTEALVSFYALLIIDQSDQRGYNPQGVDPTTSLRRTRDLIEREDFQFADEYLARLESIADRWSRRVPGSS